MAVAGRQGGGWWCGEGAGVWGGHGAMPGWVAGGVETVPSEAAVDRAGVAARIDAGRCRAARVTAWWAGREAEGSWAWTEAERGTDGRGGWSGSRDGHRLGIVSRKQPPGHVTSLPPHPAAKPAAEGQQAVVEDRRRSPAVGPPSPPHDPPWRIDPGGSHRDVVTRTTTLTPAPALKALSRPWARGSLPCNTAKIARGSDHHRPSPHHVVERL